MTAADNMPADFWHFVGFVVLLVAALWFARVMWHAIHDAPVVNPPEYESVHYLGRCEVKGCNAPARFKVESPRGVRHYCRRCLEGGAK